MPIGSTMECGLPGGEAEDALGTRGYIYSIFTLKVLSQGRLCLPQDTWQYLETFFGCHNGGKGVPLASAGERPWMTNILNAQDRASQQRNSHSLVLRLRNPSLLHADLLFDFLIA